MKKLLFAVALFIASDAAFAHSFVSSGSPQGSGPAFVRTGSNVVVEPPMPAPTPYSNGHKSKPAKGNDHPLGEFLFRLYAYLMLQH